jgi:hypothetical protein
MNDDFEMLGDLIARFHCQPDGLIVTSISCQRCDDEFVSDDLVSLTEALQRTSDHVRAEHPRYAAEVEDQTGAPLRVNTTAVDASFVRYVWVVRPHPEFLKPPEEFRR